MASIYKITNKVTKECYIGKHQEDLPFPRIKQHFRKSNNEDLKKDIEIYGVTSFTTDILEVCPFEIVTTREKKWINTYLDRGIKLYNVQWNPNKEIYRKPKEFKEEPKKGGFKLPPRPSYIPHWTSKLEK